MKTKFVGLLFVALLATAVSGCGISRHAPVGNHNTWSGGTPNGFLRGSDLPITPIAGSHSYSRGWDGVSTFKSRGTETFVSRTDGCYGSQVDVQQRTWNVKEERRDPPPCYGYSGGRTLQYSSGSSYGSSGSWGSGGRVGVGSSRVQVLPAGTMIRR